MELRIKPRKRRKGKRQEYGLTLVANNGETLLSSESYYNRVHAVQIANTIRRKVAKAKVVIEGGASEP